LVIFGAIASEDRDCSRTLRFISETSIFLTSISDLANAQIPLDEFSSNPNFFK